MNSNVYSLVLAVIFVLLLRVDAKNFTRCELVKELRSHDFPEVDMRNWVCLVEQESARQTDVVSKPNKNGSRDHGLFQINDNIWCSNTTVPGKLCNVTCAELTTDDITQATICVKTIFGRQGWPAWHGWTKRCQNNLPDIDNCTQTTAADAETSTIRTDLSF